MILSFYELLTRCSKIITDLTESLVYMFKCNYIDNKGFVFRRLVIFKNENEFWNIENEKKNLRKSKVKNPLINLMFF